MTLIACGPSISRTTYEVSEGGSLIHTYQQFATPEQAAVAFEESAKSGEAVGERRLSFDVAGQQVGERIVVRTERGVRLLKLEGRALISIEAQSEGVIERFEASGRWPD